MNSDNNTLTYSQSTAFGQNLPSQQSIDQMTDYVVPQGQVPFQNITNQPQLIKSGNFQRENSGSEKQQSKKQIQTRQQVHNVNQEQNLRKLLDNTGDLVTINEDDSGNISIQRRGGQSSIKDRYAQDNSVENVDDSDSDLTDLEAIEEGEEVEVEGSNAIEQSEINESTSLQIETDSVRTRIVQEQKSNQLSKEKSMSAIGLSGKTGKTAWQASADPAIQEEHNSSMQQSNQKNDSIEDLGCSEKFLQHSSIDQKFKNECNSVLTSKFGQHSQQDEYYQSLSNRIQQEFNQVSQPNYQSFADQVAKPAESAFRKTQEEFMKNMYQIQQLQAEQEMIEKVKTGRQSVLEQHLLDQTEVIEPQEYDSESVKEHERVRSSVFNRLYQHAINLRIKQEVKHRTANHVSKLLAKKATLNQSERYKEIIEKRGEHSLLGKQGLKVEAFSDLQQLCEIDATLVMELHKIKEQSTLFIKRFDKNIHLLVNTFKKTGVKKSLLKDKNLSQMYSKVQFAMVWESLGVLQCIKNSQLATCNTDDEFDRASKEKIFLNDLWDLINQRYDPISRKQSFKVEADFVCQYLKVVLDPYITLEEQTKVILSQREVVKQYYKAQNLPFLDKFENQDDLHVNIKLILALLRELYLNYYDLEHFNRQVENLGFKARNVKLVKEVQMNEKSRVYTFHPKVNQRSQILDQQRSSQNLDYMPTQQQAASQNSTNAIIMTPAFEDNLGFQGGSGDIEEDDDQAETDAKHEPNTFRANSSIKRPHSYSRAQMVNDPQKEQGAPQNDEEQEPPCMSEVVDSDEELSSNYHQPNLNIQTNHTEGNDDFSYLPQLEHLKEPAQGEKKINASRHHNNNPSIAQQSADPSQEVAYASVHNDQNKQVSDANFWSNPNRTPTVATIKGQPNENDADFQQCKQSTASYIVLQAANNTESQIAHFEEYPVTDQDPSSLSSTELNANNILRMEEQQRQQLVQEYQEAPQERWKSLAAHGQEYAEKKRLENEAKQEQLVKEKGWTFKPYVSRKSQMLSQQSRSDHWVVKEQDNIIEEECTTSQIYDRLYSMRDMKKEKLEQKQKEKQMIEDQEFEQLTFAPTRISVQSKGMKDKRKMFAQPKGTEQSLQRMQEGRLIKEQKAKDLEELGKIKNWTGLPTTQIPFTFRTVERQEEREQKKDDPILIVVELMLSQGKTVSIPVRKDDDASVLASNFAKTYSLNLAGQKALQDILESHILGKGIEQEGSEGLQVQDQSDELFQLDAKPTTIVEENQPSNFTSEVGQLPFQSQSVIEQEATSKQNENSFKQDDDHKQFTLDENSSLSAYLKNSQSEDEKSSLLQARYDEENNSSPIKIIQSISVEKSPSDKKRNLKDISITVTPNENKVPTPVLKSKSHNTSSTTTAANPHSGPPAGKEAYSALIEISSDNHMNSSHNLTCPNPQKQNSSRITEYQEKIITVKANKSKNDSKRSLKQ